MIASFDINSYGVDLPAEDTSAACGLHHTASVRAVTIVGVLVSLVLCAGIF